jgi:seryl-tRNA synthetase
MLDPHILRSDLPRVIAALAKKGHIFDEARYHALEQERKTLQQETEALQQQRNQLSKQVGKYKATQQDATALLHEVNQVSETLKAKSAACDAVQECLQDFCLRLPNMPHDSVPEGSSEADNVEIRRWGTIPSFDFPVGDHTDIAVGLGMCSFDRAVKIAGSRYMVLERELAALHRALIQFMLDTHTEHHGYHEVYVPYIVKEACLYGTGALPKMREDLYALEGESAGYLIPTAEVPVTNLLREEIVPHEQLPVKYVAHTPCFRSEAGSYGKDTKGIIRQHQFEKVELVQFVHAEESYDALEQLCGHAETILQKLDLPYRVVNLCGGDLSFSSAKTYDIEVWLPSQNTYREISSCSNFEAFQARRCQIRTRTPGEKKPQLVHTLNGSGLAVGRTLVAIIENYQQADGSIAIPELLQPYLRGKTHIPVA